MRKYSALDDISLVKCRHNRLKGKLFHIKLNWMTNVNIFREQFSLHFAEFAVINCRIIVFFLVFLRHVSCALWCPTHIMLLFFVVVFVYPAFIYRDMSILVTELAE